MMARAGGTTPNSRFQSACQERGALLAEAAAKGAAYNVRINAQDLAVRWLAALVLAPALCAQGAPPTPLPLKYAGPPTAPAISAADLMTRLYIFADDSMMGRPIGTDGNNKGTAYIEREVRRMGLKPAGDSGGYFQSVVSQRFSEESELNRLEIGVWIAGRWRK